MREIWPGRPHPRGATFDGVGVNFAVYSRGATRVEVCIYDPDDPQREIERFDLPETIDFVWHGYASGLAAGTLYGFRVHGPYEPEQGLRFNPNKLLIDPYAKAISGDVDWKAPVFGYKVGDEKGDLSFDDQDSAPGVPKCVVVGDVFDWSGDRPPGIPWRKTVIYEAHVKGFSKLHPEIPEEQRGTYAGLAHPAAIRHLKELGITAVELLPVHEYTDDGFLQDRLLANYWGYNTLGFFAPKERYGRRARPGSQVSEFKSMVKGLHAAGIEVILDVVYNHTCEGNHLGPTLSLRGIDNTTYYWLMPDARYYLDFTGTGNSIRAANAEAARLIVDSLRYWVTEMHVDGFRFDLATTLGRVGAGDFDRDAPIFQIINQDPVLSQVKLIAEPWDVGMGGYQLGNFPNCWREWNDRYRDTLRKYWKGDQNLASQLGYRLSGSADTYQGEHRQPQSSINFITAHDGFTLHDLVSNNGKHNEANGEDNRDGADDNDSWNHGAEGETDDPQIIELRERQKRNLLASLFTSQGVPMIVAGDEMGRTQGGNNNAYCQDDEISWIDWRLDERKQRLLEFVRRLIAMRAELPVLQRRRFFVGDYIWDSRSKDLTWLRPDGTELSAVDWQRPWLTSLAFMLGGDAIPALDERGERQVSDGLLVLMNPHHEAIRFQLPEGAGGAEWTLQFDTTDDKNRGVACRGEYEVQGRATAIFRQPTPAEAARAAPIVERAAEAEAAPVMRTPDRRIRRAGVLVPLSALRRKGNWGVGEIADIPKFAAWAGGAGFSVLQFLPVNAVNGFDASPYAAISAFALDPVYLGLDACEDFTEAGGREALAPATRDELRSLESSSHVRWDRVRALKREGIRVAFQRFLRDEWRARSRRARDLGNFMKNNRTWLDDFALFTVIHEKRQESWTDWPLGMRERKPDAISELRRERADELLEVAWVQWQLDLQWHDARFEASQHDVELMGDLPFTVSLDSADVWANRNIFRTDLHVGTPPEEASPSGQDWGLPAYDWPALQKSDFSWLRGRVARAGQLFSLYRIDHALGYYRMFFRSPDGKTTGFSPADERQQVRLGTMVMRLLRHFGEVVAEDLGNVPPFLRPSLESLSIPGYRVLRWEKDGEQYRDPQGWPAASVATSSTHDTSTSADWYDELSVDERKALAKIPALSKLDPNRGFDETVRDALLRAVYQAPSTLALVLFQDAMGARERINVPGTVAETNWSYRMPMTIEDLSSDTNTSARLRQLASDTGRSTT